MKMPRHPQAFHPRGWPPASWSITLHKVGNSNLERLRQPSKRGQTSSRLMPGRISGNPARNLGRGNASIWASSILRVSLGGSKSTPVALLDVSRMVSHSALSMRRSDTANEVCQRHFQGSGDPDQSINGDIFLSTLHVADVRRIEVRFLRKFLLAQTSPFARRADIFSQNAPMFWVGTHRNNANMNPSEPPSDIPETVLLAVLQEPDYNHVKSDVTTTDKDFLKEPPFSYVLSKGTVCRLPGQFVAAASRGGECGSPFG